MPKDFLQIQLSEELFICGTNSNHDTHKQELTKNWGPRSKGPKKSWRNRKFSSKSWWLFRAFRIMVFIENLVLFLTFCTESPIDLYACRQFLCADFKATHVINHSNVGILYFRGLISTNSNLIILSSRTCRNIQIYIHVSFCSSEFPRLFW